MKHNNLIAEMRQKYQIFDCAAFPRTKPSMYLICTKSAQCAIYHQCKITISSPGEALLLLFEESYILTS